MPPVHPAIVHFPIALLTLSFIADLFGFFYRSDSLQSAGWWSLLGAAVGAAAAVIAGLWDMNREEIEHKAHERVHTHLKIGLVVFALIAGLTIWRWIIYSNVEYSLGWFYLIFALSVLALTFFQGWLGSELVYGYGVGVAPTGQGAERASEAKERVREVVGESGAREK